MLDTLKILYSLQKQTGRPVQAYAAVFEVLDWIKDPEIQKMLGIPEGHITGQQLAKAMLYHNISQHGLLAESVWSHYKIFSGKDVGDIVYDLVEHRLIGKQDTDQRSDFDDPFTLDGEPATLRQIFDSIELSIEYDHESKKLSAKYLTKP